MKLICIKEVRDKYTKELYVVGNIYEFETNRGAEVVGSIYFIELPKEEVVQQDDLNDENDGLNDEKSEMTASEIKAKLTELGVEFKGNASRVSLQELLDAKLAE